MARPLSHQTQSLRSCDSHREIKHCLGACDFLPLPCESLVVSSRGSASAEFESLLELHKGILYKVVRAYCHNPSDFDDLAQEIIVQLWRSFPAFDPETARFSTWVYRVALNVSVSFYRRERLRAHEPLSETRSGLLQMIAPLSDELRMIYDWIGKLDEVNKALVLLHLDGQSYQEIASILGISETNIATRLSRLRAAMKLDLTGGATNATR